MVPFAAPASFTVRQSLVGSSPITDLMAFAHFKPVQATPHEMQQLYTRIVLAARRGERDSIYYDTLVLTKGDQAVEVRVDMANTQFHGAALSMPPFANGYEPEILALMARFLPEDGVLFDVGANWGYFVFHALLDPKFSGRVVAVEPVKASMADLRNIAISADLVDRVDCLQVAAGDYEGQAPISNSATSGDQSLVDASEDGEIVTVVRLDEATRATPAFIKIDVENMEAAAIRGMAQLIGRTHPPVIFENWHAPERDSLAPLHLMSAHGYDLYAPEFSIESTNEARAPFEVAGTIRLTPFTPAERGAFPPRLNIFAHYGPLPPEFVPVEPDSAAS